MFRTHLHIYNTRGQHRAHVACSTQVGQSCTLAPVHGLDLAQRPVQTWGWMSLTALNYTFRVRWGPGPLCAACCAHRVEAIPAPEGLQTGQRTCCCSLLRQETLQMRGDLAPFLPVPQACCSVTHLSAPFAKSNQACERTGVNQQKS